jgi:VWFA-related protein
MLLAAWLLTSSALLPTAVQSADTPRPQTISITAVATDRGGRPVASLKRDDFTLRDEGTPRPLDAVEFKRGAGRLFALFFDEYHVTAGPATMRAREALAHFVDEQTRTEDRFVAMKPLDPITAIRPTADRALIRQLVDRFAGCKGDYAPRTTFETEYMSRAPESAAIERARVVVSDLTALAAQLAAVQDMPKAIVFVTEGTGGDLRAVSRTANRSGVTIYVIDPGETPQDASAALRAVTEDTGGMLTTGAANLQTALSNVAKDLDAYYVLTYRTERPADGKFHALEIGTRRPGVQVRARRGYWSPLPPFRRAMGPSSSFSMDDLLSAHASNLIRPWFRMTRGPQGRTRLMFSWQPSQATAPAKSGTPELLQLRAATADGTALFDGAVSAAPRASTTEQSAPSRVVIDVPPGRLRTEMRISDAGARLLDRDIRFLEIPNLYASGVIITTPEILRSRTARQFRELTAEHDAVPTPARDFNRSERLLIRVHAYGPGEASPQVNATLVNAIGQRLHALERVTEGPNGMVQFDLPLAALARGSYSIEIAAAAGASRTSQMIPIHVIG